MESWTDSFNKQEVHESPEWGEASPEEVQFLEVAFRPRLEG